MKTFFKTLLAGLVLLAAIIIYNTVTFSSKQIDSPAFSPIKIGELSVQHMQEAIQLPTISTQDTSTFQGLPFLEFHKFLSTAYPLTDSLLEKKVINNYSLLYKWTGKNGAAKPVILMAHIDVVPVDPPTFKDWKFPPYSGKIHDNEIWGRGTLDDKASLISIMESVEMLLEDGYQPEKTIYLAFGHDEEIGGNEGAAKIADSLFEEGIEPDLILDEGGFILDGFIPGLDQPLAMIATAEKGYLTLELSVSTQGGHSSMPTRANAIGTLATAIHTLENNQFDYHMIETSRDFIDHVGPEMPFIMKVAFANPWLFGRFLLEGLNNHTTIAPTIIGGGVKENVLPTLATVVINFRILPGESSEMVINHVKEVINNDRVKIKPIMVMEPSPISSADAEVYNLLAGTIRQIYPEITVAPGLTPGGTDTKHYQKLSNNVYRFAPYTFSPGGEGPHSLNEHIPVEEFKAGIQFYHQLILNINQPE